jgi:hypothetical protein
VDARLRSHVVCVLVYKHAQARPCVRYRTCAFACELVARGREGVFYLGQVLSNDLPQNELVKDNAAQVADLVSRVLSDGRKRNLRLRDPRWAHSALYGWSICRACCALSRVLACECQARCKGEG